MSDVLLRAHDSLERALKLLRPTLGVLKKRRRRRYYVKHSSACRLKAAAAGRLRLTGRPER